VLAAPEDPQPAIANAQTAVATAIGTIARRSPRGGSPAPGHTCREQMLMRASSSDTLLTAHDGTGAPITLA
jgi:hypothetical protein